MLKQKTKVAVGLSGGVDSSVAAALLLDQGYDVIGVHALTYRADMPGCSGSADRADALMVAKHLHIPLRMVDFRQEYQERVIDRFVKEYQKGRTPNPDIWCNEEIKFGLMMECVNNELGASKMATGHYSRIRQIRNSKQGIANKLEIAYQLLSGLDSKKDQSYFLYRLTQDQLSKTLFPLGELTKDEVRELAKKYRLPTADKPDSVGICFIGDIDVKEFLRERIDFQSGEVVDTKGNVIGSHDGVMFYTIGQRHGFELTEYQGEPLYVVEKKVEENQLVVGRDQDSDVTSLTVTDLHFHDKDKGIWLSEKLKVRIRHLGKLESCHVGFSKEKDDLLFCKLESPIRGVSPGQHAVFYIDDVVVGGGVIELTR